MYGQYCTIFVTPWTVWIFSKINVLKYQDKHRYWDTTDFGRKCSRGRKPELALRAGEAWGSKAYSPRIQWWPLAPLIQKKHEKAKGQIGQDSWYRQNSGLKNINQIKREVNKERELMVWERVKDWFLLGLKNNYMKISVIATKKERRLYQTGCPKHACLIPLWITSERSFKNTMPCIP